MASCRAVNKILNFSLSKHERLFFSGSRKRRGAELILLCRNADPCFLSLSPSCIYSLHVFASTQLLTWSASEKMAPLSAGFLCYWSFFEGRVKKNSCKYLLLAQLALPAICRKQYWNTLYIWKPRIQGQYLAVSILGGSDRCLVMSAQKCFKMPKNVYLKRVLLTIQAVASAPADGRLPVRWLPGTPQIELALLLPPTPQQVMSQ